MINPERAGVLAESLAADGYHMEIAEAGNHVTVTITATPQACADCLVPKDLMRVILSDALGADAGVIDLIYPQDQAQTPGRAE